MIKSVFGILIFIFALSYDVTANDDFIEKGWKGILPLKTDRITVEKIIGSPKTSKDGFYNYDLPDAFAHINYSSEPCRESYYGRGKYNVPQNTVLDYQVTFTKKIKLENFKFERKKYEREEDSEIFGLAYYKDGDNGIVITTAIADGFEYVREVHFYPRPKPAENCECRNNKEDN